MEHELLGGRRAFLCCVPSRALARARAVGRRGLTRLVLSLDSARGLTTAFPGVQVFDLGEEGEGGAVEGVEVGRGGVRGALKGVLRAAS